MASTEIEEWLLNALVSLGYTHPEIARVDIMNLLASYPSVRPKTQVYTNDSGNSRLLLYIFGSIPAIIKGKTYRIPVEMWVPPDYPIEPPEIYVTPTEKMTLQPGNHVDNNGRCYSFLLHEWKDKGHSANIIRVTDELSKVFSSEPPVFAKMTQPQNILTQPGTITSRNNLRNVKLKARESPQITSPNKHSSYFEAPFQPNIMDSELIIENEDILVTERNETLNFLNDSLHKLFISDIQPRTGNYGLRLCDIKDAILNIPKILDFQSDQIKEVNKQISVNKILISKSIDETRDIQQKTSLEKELDTDETVTSETILFYQLYRLVCEDQAMDDCQYVLGKALDNGLISSKRYTKFSRSVGRDQFMKRALILMISQKLRLYQR